MVSAAPDMYTETVGEILFTGESLFHIEEGVQRSDLMTPIWFNIVFGASSVMMKGNVTIDGNLTGIG